MKKKNIFIVILAYLCLININFAFADGMWDVEGWDPYSSNSTSSTTTDNKNTGKFGMSTQEFDAGMEKGISYFNQGLYYEAKDEFMWFKDYNYDRMNSGQQKYLDDYLNGTWDRIEQWEDAQNRLNITRNEALQIIMRYDSRCGDPVIIDEDDNYYYIRAFMYYNKLNGYHAFPLGDYKVNKSTGEIQKIL